ncbi:uncharacterized protein RCC_02555 [Ramularia collo-cygni]|uniref:Uncharacterized protein n=1 Tax=Ramularia collo-cygni TaxID=112498 RepID=A0A2D3UUR9_9PEZI|nr:uncharacterized protein RCC_02555 [Ramularia collo-cygni]CZT16720.1 uncharacterized protein RCC_02555 [Ramularia collo-cygni]
MASSTSRRRPPPAHQDPPPPPPESFASLSARNDAVKILQSYEKLSWCAFARCETIQQTRLYFQNIVAGFNAQDEEGMILWKEDFSKRPVTIAPSSTATATTATNTTNAAVNTSGGAEGSRKGKGRVSSGGGGGRHSTGGEKGKGRSERG